MLKAFWIKWQIGPFLPAEIKIKILIKVESMCTNYSELVHGGLQKRQSMRRHRGVTQPETGKE